MKSLIISTCCAGVIALGLAASTQAAAQEPVRSPDGKSYTYVEKMPQLPGRRGLAAIVAAIQQHVQYPSEAVQADVQGKVYVEFVVEADGQIDRIRIIRGLQPDCDTAAAQAVRQLPRFKPGVQDGQPVAVSFTVPVTFRITDPKPLKSGQAPR